MPLIIKGNSMSMTKSHSIVLPSGIDATIEYNKFNDIGGSAILVNESFQQLIRDGFKEDIPLDVLVRFINELSSHNEASLEEKEQIAVESGLSKWIEKGANLATIVSTISSLIS